MLEQNSFENLDLKEYQLKQALLSDCSSSSNEDDWEMDSSQDYAPQIPSINDTLKKLNKKRQIQIVRGKNSKENLSLNDT